MFQIKQSADNNPFHEQIKFYCSLKTFFIHIQPEFAVLFHFDGLTFPNVLLYKYTGK